MADKKKPYKVNKNKNTAIFIAAAVLLALAVYSAMLNNQQQQITSANKNRSVLTENSGQPAIETEEADKKISADVPTGEDLKLLKSEITETVTFHPYNADGVYMEVLALKATDGSIRTALNTCQVCFNSGQGYYRQEGSKLICQNCGNRFGVDDVEIVRGGCNPVPVLQEYKNDEGEYITINKDFLEENKELFVAWRR